MWVCFECRTTRKAVRNGTKRTPRPPTPEASPETSIELQISVDYGVGGKPQEHEPYMRDSLPRTTADSVSARPSIEYSRSEEMSLNKTWTKRMMRTSGDAAAELPEYVSGSLHIDPVIVAVDDTVQAARRSRSNVRVESCL